MAPKKSIKADSLKKEDASEVEKGVNILNKLDTFNLINEKNEKVNLKEILENETKEGGGIIIFLYPKANTPGCTKQALGFSNLYEKFKQHKFSVFGLSKDKFNTQSSWHAKLKLPYNLLSDETSNFIDFIKCDKKPGTIRSHIIISKKGEILDIKRAISPVDSYTKALEVAESLGEEGDHKKKSKSTEKKEMLKKEEKNDGTSTKNTVVNQKRKQNEKTEDESNEKRKKEKDEKEEKTNDIKKSGIEKEVENLNSKVISKKKQSEKKIVNDTKKQKEKLKKKEEKEEKETQGKKKVKQEIKKKELKKRKNEQNGIERKSQRVKSSNKN